MFRNECRVIFARYIHSQFSLFIIVFKLWPGTVSGKPVLLKEAHELAVTF